MNTQNPTTQTDNSEQIAELESDYRHLANEISAARDYLQRKNDEGDLTPESEEEANVDIERWENNKSHIGEELRKLRGRE